jgi:hypothetical protein
MVTGAQSPQKGPEPERTKLQLTTDVARLVASLIKVGYYLIRWWDV